MPSAAFLTEMSRLRGSRPRTKIEFIDKSDVVTDITEDFLGGANLETIKERAPDEIQAGSFDIVLDNADDKYSEYKPSSLLYQSDYHGARIRISEGFLLPDGTEEYEVQGIGYIDQILVDPSESKITFRCRDILWRVMDQLLNPKPPASVPVPSVDNIGNGNITFPSSLPFVTINQDWTLTCTTAGLDNVAQFSLVGSVSGSIGPVTSGVEFSDSIEGIKFTIEAGSLPWQVGDVYTWSSKQLPEWDGVNAGKIIWGILTGYNWDTNTQENWSESVFDYDNTQSSANIHLDYDSFVTVINNIDALGVFDLKGYIPYDSSGVDVMQTLLLLFIGSIYTGNDGRIKIKSYIPEFGEILAEFKDSEKITFFGYTRTIDEIINSITVNYKARDIWAFSDASFSYDGSYVESNPASITKYKKLALSFNIPWYTQSGLHVQDFTSKLISKFSEPPLNIEMRTGLDALTVEIGDNVRFSDTKLGFSSVRGEISRVMKIFASENEPASIELRIRRDAQVDQQFGFIGSEIDEGDGLSPQSDDYDTATDTDKLFAYFGSTATTDPDYRIF